MHVACGKRIGWHAAKVALFDGFTTGDLHLFPVWTQKNEVVLPEAVASNRVFKGIRIDKSDITGFFFEALQGSSISVVVFFGGIHGTFIIFLAGTRLAHPFSAMLDIDVVKLQLFPLAHEPVMAGAKHGKPADREKRNEILDNLITETTMRTH